MKKINIHLAAWLLVMLAASQGRGASVRPMALTIIWDTSPTTKSHWDDFTALSRQAIGALEPHDYLEVISAHHEGVRLRVAQSIKTAGSDESENIATLLDNIRCATFLDADMAKALDMTSQRLDQTASRQEFADHAVIILTDGRFKDTEAERIRETAGDFRQRN